MVTPTAREAGIYSLIGQICVHLKLSGGGGESAKVKVLVPQSCLTLRPHGLCSQSGSSVNGILQARILEWVAIPFSRALNLHLLHCRQILNHRNHRGSLGCLLLKGRGELEVGIMVSFQHTTLSLYEINFLTWHK